MRIRTKLIRMEMVKELFQYFVRTHIFVTLIHPILVTTIYCAEHCTVYVEWVVYKFLYYLYFDEPTNRSITCKALIFLIAPDTTPA
jgi:hypothetical protein